MFFVHLRDMTFFCPFCEAYNTRSSKLIACLNAGLNSVHFFKLSGTLLVERSKRQNNEIKNTNNTN